MGYRTGKLLALGYVKSGALGLGDTCHIQAFGVLRSALRHNHHAYDPENRKLRS